MNLKRLITGLACAAVLASSLPAQPMMYGWVQRRSLDGSGTIYALEQISLTSSPAFTTVMSTDYTAVANGGICIADGKLSAVYVNRTNLLWGQLTSTYYEYDTHTWQQLTKSDVTDARLVALETALHAESGTVYGMFYQADMNTRTFDWGVIDYATMTRTTLATSSHRMVAVGVTADRIVYGIASDGNLYRFDPATATETLVGKTGLSVSVTAVQSGEIDQESGEFYWAYTSGMGASALYTVSLETGAATKLGDFPGGEQISGMTMIPAAIAGDVPAAAADMQVTFAGAATTGVVSFTAPSTCYDGSVLSGPLRYTITANGEEIAMGNVQAGDPKTVEITVPEGQTEIALVISNANGDSPKARKSLYVGYDIPEPAADVMLAISDGVASVTWTAPSRGLHEAYIGNLTYDVVRYPDAKVVAQGISETTFSETLTNSDITVYRYGIIVHNGTQQSQETQSNEEKFGTSGLYSVPIDFSFADDRYVDELRATDSNGDGKTWTYSMANHALTSANDRRNQLPGDDWCFMPGVNLKAGYTYTISIHAKTYLANYPTRIEAKMGHAAQVENMAIAVFDTISLNSNQYGWYKADVTVPADGGYYLGIHDVSVASGYSTHIDDITIEVASVPHAPKAVTALEVVADPEGLLKAGVSFTAPMLCVDETELDVITRIEVLRDGELVATRENVPAGTVIDDVVDAVPANGEYTYTVVPYLEAEAGLTAEKKAYVGMDIPEAPQNLYAVDRGTAIELRWDKASARGINGGVVKPDEVYYDVLAGDMITHLDTVQTNFFVIDSLTNVGTQHIARFYVKSHNIAGRNNYYITTVLPVGAPYTLPFSESFAGAKASRFCWTEAGTATLTTNPQVSVDGDGGSYMMLLAEAGTQGSFNTGKIALGGAANPQLVFSCKSSKPGADAHLKMVVMTPSHDTDTISDIHFAQSSSTDWDVVKLPLAKYAGEDYVVIKFVGSSQDAERLSVFIDRIGVRDLKDDDLAVAVAAPSRATKGETVAVTATVTNLGNNTAGGYTLRLLADDAVVQEVVISQPLEGEQKAAHTLSYLTGTVVNEAASVSLAVQVVAEGDQNSANDIATATVGLHDALASPVENLRAEDGSLRWDAPSQPAENVAESFEKYDSQLIGGIGRWLCYDGDQSLSAAFSDFTYEYQGKPFAFMTFNPGELGITASYPALAPHSGEQSMMAIVGYTDGNRVDADNWLISPELTGDEQVISLWVLNSSQAETFEVLYSKGGTDYTDFLSIKSDEADGRQWKQVKVSLPEGAKRFAIHHNTKAANALLFMIDDVEFKQAAGEPVEYRVYCDGVLVETVSDLDGVALAQTAGNGSHTLSVTAVYASGAESVPATLTVSPLNGDVNGDGNVNAADVTALYNYILSGDDTYLATSDVNGDGDVNAADVTAVYNIILGL